MIVEKNAASKATLCYHCGEKCAQKEITFDEKAFCCKGCMSVYQLLNASQLNNYYCLNNTPGTTVESIQPERFQFLDDNTIVQQLLIFKNKTQAQVAFYLPQMHCSSCLWLLEHLSGLNPNIINSQVNFTTKTATITYDYNKISLRAVAELLTSIGYEPHIDIHQKDNRLQSNYNSKTAYIKIGIVGFCFANIMMISFPEYLGMESASESKLSLFFRGVNLLLSLPVLLYGAKEFFVNAWYSYKQRYLNIDAPIALAITVTFLRSIYEIFSNTGNGYLDSMAGIVFFMLLGRTLQNRTYTTLSFNRDFKSYFPIAIKRIHKNGSESIKIQEIEEHDSLLVHHNEVIPTDCLLSKGNAMVDYSFITGESMPESVDKGQLIYAGGKNVGEAIEVIAVKSFSQNSFTQLWNNKVFEKDDKLSDSETRTTKISKYFSIVVILISLTTFITWSFYNTKTAWLAATAILIIACPCTLLLTATFSNGYLIELLSKHGFFLKNSRTIESLAQCNHIAFDKTGTITETVFQTVSVEKNSLSEMEQKTVLNMMAQSTHPLSNAIVHYYQYELDRSITSSIKEILGMGIEGWANDKYFKIGSRKFIFQEDKDANKTEVLVSIDGALKAIFSFEVHLRSGTQNMIQQLGQYNQLSLVSGDNENAKSEMEQLFPKNSALLFNCSPTDKLEHIQSLQSQGKKVMMVGDGLNDAGALQQSNVGITVVKNSFSFSPACDVIMEASRLSLLPNYIKTAKAVQKLILIGFGYSIIFNIIGVTFSVMGKMTPLVAAILMPSSSLGIILIAWIGIQRIKKLYLTKK